MKTIIKADIGSIGGHTQPENKFIRNFLLDSIILTLTMIVIVTLMWLVRWVIALTGNSILLAVAEIIYEVVKYTSFILLSIERFVAFVAQTMDSIVQNIIKIRNLFPPNIKRKKRKKTKKKVKKRVSPSLSRHKARKTEADIYGHERSRDSMEQARICSRMPFPEMSKE